MAEINTHDKKESLSIDLGTPYKVACVCRRIESHSHRHGSNGHDPVAAGKGQNDAAYGPAVLSH